MLLLEDDVVDQAGRADADRAGENGWVEGGDLDVVDVEAVQRSAGGGEVAGRQGAGERECLLALPRREPPVA